MKREKNLKIILVVLFALLVVTKIGAHIEYRIYLNRIEIQLLEIIDQTQQQIEIAYKDERTIEQEMIDYPGVLNDLLPAIGILTDTVYINDMSTISSEKCIADLNAYLVIYLNSNDKQTINKTIDELAVITENEIIRGYFEGQETLYSQWLIYEQLMTTGALLEKIDSKLAKADKQDIKISKINYNEEKQTVYLFGDQGKSFASVKLQVPELIPNDYVVERMLDMRPVDTLKKTKVQERKEVVYQLFVYLGIKVDHHGNLKPSVVSTLAVGYLTDLYLNGDGDFKTATDDFFNKEVRGHDKQVAFENMHYYIYYLNSDIYATVIYRPDE